MTTGRHALIADPDRQLLGSYSVALRRSGFEVVTTNRGQVCEERMRQHHFDALILDIDLIWDSDLGKLAGWAMDSPLAAAPALVLSNSRRGPSLYRLLRLMSFPRSEYRDKPLEPGPMAELVRRLVASPPLAVTLP